MRGSRRNSDLKDIRFQGRIDCVSAVLEGTFGGELQKVRASFWISQLETCIDVYIRGDSTVAYLSAE